MAGQPREAEPLASLAQTRLVFLAGCGLPAVWAGQLQWRVLETRFERGLSFLLTWQAWRNDPERPRLLHFVALLADEVSKAELLDLASEHPEIAPLANELAAQWNGLLPGMHRLAFDGGHVMLTLGVGDASAGLLAWAWFRDQHLCVDSIYLTDCSRPDAAHTWNAHLFKALARCCRTGTRVASAVPSSGVLAGLQQSGFLLQETPGSAAACNSLQAVFKPRWLPRKKIDNTWPLARSGKTCVVIGAGLSGAAAAASLARRGWQVTVLDTQPAPAGGASSLPAGFLVPHVSPDDGILSRLSRSGLRATWQTVAELLQPGDWQTSGVLQRRLDASARLPADWSGAGKYWSQEADRAVHGAACDEDAQPPLWHAAGGWVKPAQLVKALLSTAGVSWRCEDIASIKRVGGEEGKDGRNPTPIWQALDAQGLVVAQAEMLVIAAGPASASLLSQVPVQAPPLQPVRGQLLWGPCPKAEEGQSADFAAAMPQHPVNGLGGLIPLFSAQISGQSQPHWLLGATFERGERQPLIRADDTQQLQDRLAQLWPLAVQTLVPQIAAGMAHTWAGVRCSSPDRLPLVGPLDEAAAPGLWLCTAMGSRGLTFAVLCGELLAAWANDEPLPLEKRLAQHLLASRFKQV